MNILKSLYSNYWKAGGHNFKIVNHEEEYFSKTKSIEGTCKILAKHLNWDCENECQPIDDFVLNYLIVDDDKEIFTIDFEHKGEEVVIYLENDEGELVVCFDMSEYIEADERYY